MDSFYKGLLIKVIIRCTYRGQTDDHCLMLKAQGTHQCKFHAFIKTIVVVVASCFFLQFCFY